MRRRNTKIHEFVTPTGSKVLTAKFGNKSKSVMAAGDNLNNLSLWKISKDKPLVTLNHTSVASQTAQVEVTAVQFNGIDTEVFSGSNRGIINIWDIASEKLSMTLKGHTVGVNCLNIFPLDELKNLLISGSFDTQIKVWDLRQRSAINTFKGHTMQVNCIAGSPDGKFIVSGSSDGLLKLWDLSTSKVLHSFVLHDAPVQCVKFNPMDMAMASGGADRTVKYWDLEHLTLISSTRPDATPVQEIIFNQDGKALFSASHESLKVWNLEKDGLLLDNVESQWRGVQDMAISDVDNMLLGLSATSSQFSLYACPISLINLSEDSIPKKPSLLVRQSQSSQGNSQVQYNLPNSYSQQHQSNQMQSLINPNIQSNLQQNPQQNISMPQQIPQQPPILQPQNQKPLPGQHPIYSQQGQNADKNQQKQINIQQNLQDVHKDINQALQNLNLVTNDWDEQKQQKIKDQQQQFLMSQGGMGLTNVLHGPMAKQNQNQLINMNQQNQNFIPEKKANQLSQVEEEEIPDESNVIVDLKYDNIYQTAQIEEPPLLSYIPISKQTNPKMIQKQDSNFKEEIEEEIKVGDELQEEEVKYSEEQYQQDLMNKSQQNQIHETNMLDQSNLTICDSIGGNFNFSSLYQGKDKEKFMQFDIINDILCEHPKVDNILSQRVKSLELIQRWWSTGNVKYAINAINDLQDPCLILDAMYMAITLNKLQYITLEGNCFLLQKARDLIEGKYQTHIKGGLEFSKRLLDQYRDEIVNIKTFSGMSKNDLAREQRVQSYNNIIEEFRKLHKLPRLKKIAIKGKEEIGEMGKRILIDLEYLFSKIDK